MSADIEGIATYTSCECAYCGCKFLSARPDNHSTCGRCVRVVAQARREQRAADAAKVRAKAVPATGLIEQRWAKLLEEIAKEIEDGE